MVLLKGLADVDEGEEDDEEDEGDDCPEPADPEDARDELVESTRQLLGDGALLGKPRLSPPWCWGSEARRAVRHEARGRRPIRSDGPSSPRRGSL